MQLWRPAALGRVLPGPPGTAHVAAGWSQARAKPSRQEDLSCHYLRPVVTACSRASGAGTLCSLSGAPVQRLLRTARFLGVAAARPAGASVPVRRHTEVPALWLVSGASLASVFCWSLNRGEFRGPENVDEITSLNYSAVFSKTWMMVFCVGSCQRRAFHFGDHAPSPVV